MELFYIIIFFIAVIALAIWLENLVREASIKNAGNRGEKLASQIISSELNNGDVLLRNVEIQVDRKMTELDNLIINRNGVFIIEVKNFTGKLYGREEDSEWSKEKTTESYNVYVKTVRNPIGQLKREIYLLKRYLKSCGIDVWVEGYVYFVQHNAPCFSNYFLQTNTDIHHAVHQSTQKPLSDKTIDKIMKALR